MRARKFLNGLEPAFKIGQLQRGRACEGAEIEARAERAEERTALQRGRACEGAEMRRRGWAMRS